MVFIEMCWYMYMFEVIDIAKVIVHQQKPVPDTVMIPSVEIYEDCSSHFPLINHQYPSSCTCKNSIQMIINCSRKHTCIFTSCSLLWIRFYTYNPVNDRNYDVITPYIHPHNTLFKNRFRSIGGFFWKCIWKAVLGFYTYKVITIKYWIYITDTISINIWTIQKIVLEALFFYKCIWNAVH